MFSMFANLLHLRPNIQQLWDGELIKSIMSAQYFEALLVVVYRLYFKVLFTLVCFVLVVT